MSDLSPMKLFISVFVTIEILILFFPLFYVLEYVLLHSTNAMHEYNNLDSLGK